MKRIIYISVGLFTIYGCDRANTGDIRAAVIAEGTAVKVSAQTGGLIQRLMVAESDQVEIGDTLAVIDTVKLGLQFEQVRANIAELEVQKQIVAAELRIAREQYDYAQEKYERLRTLYTKNAATEQNRDDAKISFDHAETNLQKAKLTLNSLDSRMKGLQAQARLIRRQIEDAIVTSPLQGTVTTRFFEAGETVPPAAPLVEIIDLASMWAKIYVTEPELPRIKVGQPARVSVDGLSDPMEGKVSWISSRAEFTPKNILTEDSRTALVYAVKVSVDNHQGILKHGMPVTVSLEL